MLHSKQTYVWQNWWKLLNSASFLFSIQNITQNYFLQLGAESPKAVKKLMALSEPGKTRPRKQGPFTTSGQTSKRTSSVSSIQSTHSSSSLPPSAKGHKSKTNNLIGTQISCDKTNVHYSVSASSAGQSSSSIKSHERSKSDLSAIKLSAESSSVTSLPSLKKGLGNHG